MTTEKSKHLTKKVKLNFINLFTNKLIRKLLDNKENNSILLNLKCFWVKSLI